MHGSTSEASRTHTSNLSQLSCSRTLLVFSIVLQLAGCIAPGWMYLHYSWGDIHIGLWWRIMCQKHKSCENDTLGDFGLYITQDGESLDLYRAFVILGIIFCIAAMKCLTYVVRSLSPKNDLQQQKYMLGGTLLTSLVSSCVSSYSAGKIWGYNKYLADAYDDDTVNVPYALFLSGLGGLIALVVCLRVLLVVLCHVIQQQCLNDPQTTTLSPVYMLNPPSNPEMVTMTTV